MRDKAFNIAKNSKYDGYQHGLASMVYNFFVKKSASLADRYGPGSGIKNENISNKELAESYINQVLEIQEKKSTLTSLFIDNIWGADLADMQLISKFNKGICFLLCVIDIFSKYAWVIPLKDKNSTTIINAFQKTLDESNRKANKIWLDKDSIFYNRSMKSFFQNNNIEMYSTLN